MNAQHKVEEEILHPKHGTETTFFNMVEAAIILGYKLFEFKRKVYITPVAVDCNARGYSEDQLKEKAFLFEYPSNVIDHFPEFSTQTPL